MSLLKRAHFERLLGSEWSVFVYLDPRAPEVVVPSEHKKNAVLLLEIGLNMPVHVPLSVEDDGFIAILSFNRVPFRCEVPWTKVFALTGKSDKRGCVFQEDVPQEVRALQLRGFGKDDGLVVAPVSSTGLTDHQDEKQAVGAPAPTHGLRVLKGGKS